MFYIINLQSINGLVIILCFIYIFYLWNMELLSHILEYQTDQQILRQIRPPPQFSLALFV